jgi:beta-glucosidase
MTWPQNLEEAAVVVKSEPEIIKPASEQVFTYSEGLHVGYRAYKGDVDPDALNYQGREPYWAEYLLDLAPLFPFGHGLSYTTFGFADPVVRLNFDSSMTVHLRVRNEGKIAGAEVVQMYVTTLQRPRKLCSFKRTPVIAGGSHTLVQMFVSARDVSAWYDADSDSWQTLDGGAPVWLEFGRSSSNILQKVFLKIPDNDHFANSAFPCC